MGIYHEFEPVNCKCLLGQVQFKPQQKIVMGKVDKKLEIYVHISQIIQGCLMRWSFHFQFCKFSLVVLEQS